MEYEFRIRNEITERAEGISLQTNEESHRGRAVRNGYQGTLESDDRIAENTDRVVDEDQRHSSEPCDEGRVYDTLGSADQGADGIFGSVSGRNGRVPGNDEVLGNGYRPCIYQGECIEIDGRKYLVLSVIPIRNKRKNIAPDTANDKIKYLISRGKK